MFLLRLVLLFFHHGASKWSGYFMRLMHQSFVTTAPKPGGGWEIAGQMSRFFLFFLLLHCPHSDGVIQWMRYTKANMAVQCKTCLTTGENCHGFTSLVYPQCGGHSRELLIKSLNYCCPQGWGRVVSTDDCYITKYLFPAYTKPKCGYQNVQTCSMVSIYVSTAWICFIVIICMHTLCLWVEVDWNLQTKI